MNQFSPTFKTENGFSLGNNEAASCPNCKQAMRLQSLPGHYTSKVNIDVCHACNLFWFDSTESTQLSPDGVVELFQLINSNKGAQTPQIAQRLACTRCKKQLVPRRDQVNTGIFNYFACDDGHGRLTTFYQFLIEKKFVRTLSKIELDKLALEVRQIKCSGCGAAVNVGKESACSYCRAPIAVFDREAAKKAIDHYLSERKRQLPARPPSQPQAALAQQHSSSTGEGVSDLALDIVWAMAQFVGTTSRRQIGSGSHHGGIAEVGSLPLPSAEEALGQMASADAPIGATALDDLGSLLEGVSLPESLPNLGGIADLADASGDIVGAIAENGGDLVDLVTDGIGALIEGLF
jgi:Transcription factor zinc-finger